MNNYVRTGALGAATCGGASPEKYKWVNGKCVNMETRAVYPGDQKLSNCQCLHGPAPSRLEQTYSFLKDAFLGGATQTGPMPQASITAQSLVVPAVVVVGGVALLLILKKKK